MYRNALLWLLGAALSANGSAASAQGLILQLPQDGRWIRYEGTYTQTELRPNTATGKLEIPPWTEHVTIKSVGSEQAEYRGEMTPCRWIEIKVERGRESEGKIDTGLTGLEIYKVLVPESLVTSAVRSADGIPASFTPIVKGFRQVGKAAPQPVAAAALKLYPLAIVLGYCRDFTKEQSDVDVAIGGETFKTTVLNGVSAFERTESRTELQSQVWSSSEVPFGVAAWTTRITRSIKDAQERRDSFHQQTEIQVEMKARETGVDAKSELNVTP